MIVICLANQHGDFWLDTCKQLQEAIPVLHLSKKMPMPLFWYFLSRILSLEFEVAVVLME